MKITTRVLVALLAAGVSAPALASAQAPQPQAAAQAAAPALNIHPSKQALKALTELQAAVKSNDRAAIQAKIAAAQAVVSTKEDHYFLAQMQAQAAMSAKDNAALAAAIDALGATGYVDASKMSGLYVNHGANFYEAKQYDQAAASFQKATALDPRNPDAMIDLGEVRLAQGNKTEAAATMEKAIQAQLAAGQKPEEKLYRRAL